jgi:hypothetical protein
MEQVLMRDVQRWLAPRPAWVVAREGTLWVTRSGDLEDHVLPPGERLAVARGDDLVVQAWRRDAPAVWDWQPRAALPAHRLRRALPGWVWAGSARALRMAAAGLAALARSAAAMANRAQGCICPADSIASAGTAQ